MDEDLKKLLEKNLEATEHSIKLLKKIHRAMLFQRIYVAIKWSIFIALLVVSYIQLQPYFSTLAASYGNVFKTLEQLNSSLPGNI